MISKDNPVRLLLELTMGLDYTTLYNTYSTIGKNPAIDPTTLFRILIYVYMNKIYSNREFDKGCKRDINFIWLFQRQKALNHNIIARFRGERLGNYLGYPYKDFKHLK
ncbi:hypothetical protein UT300005_19820 [Clostridium sp. CTA-5]